jgi:hypothetical protein
MVLESLLEIDEMLVLSPDSPLLDAAFVGRFPEGNDVFLGNFRRSAVVAVAESRSFGRDMEAA